MRIAITGSHGLIGSALVESLENDGHEVVRVVRSGASGPGIARWDLDAGTIDAGALEGLDGVVHLAGEGIGEKRWTDEQKRKVLRSRTMGTALLASTLAGLQRRPPVLLSGSAIGYYGDRGDEVLVESSPPGDLFLSEVCTAWEAAAKPAGDAGIRVTYLRTGIVLAGEGGALAPLLRIFRLGLGGRLGSGRQWWSWITLRDEVAAIRFLLEHAVAGPVNLAAPNPVTNADFAAALGRALHRPAVLPVPSFGPGLLLGRDLARELLFASQRVQPAALLSAGFRFTDDDLDAALAAVLPSNARQ
jgi:uncharacterized protein (TIGR01777 family)